MNKIANYLLKQAAEPLNEADTDISLRHYFLPAQLAALQGLSPKQQRQANWDALKLTAGGIGTSATLALLGGLFGKYVADDEDQGKVLGGLIGGIAGLPLGTYLTHKLIQSNRGLGPEYNPGFSSLYGLIAPKAALSLQGVSKEDQKQVTKDMVKLMGGRYLGSTLSGGNNSGLGGVVGNAMMYKNLKDDRMRTQQYNSMQQQIQQLQEQLQSQQDAKPL